MFKYIEPVLSSAEMKHTEERVINTQGIPSLCLMEEAALFLTNSCISNQIINKHSSILVVCGSGNNGADAFCIARILFLKGFDVNILFIGDEYKLTHEAAIHKNVCQNLCIEFIKSEDLNFKNYTVIIDGIFGIGLSREVSGQYYDAIRSINECSKSNFAKVISIDIPSGLSADNGKVLNIAVKADYTFSFGFKKRGYFLGKGPDYVGQLLCDNISMSLDDSLSDYSFTATFEQLIKSLPSRIPTGNKGSFGKVLCISGSSNMAGAMILSSKAAFKSGAGMVKIISDEVNRTSSLHEIPEAMFESIDDLIDKTTNELLYNKIKNDLKWCDCIIIGPGLSVDVVKQKILMFVLENSEKPVIVDADALNIIAKDKNLFFDILKKRGSSNRTTIITPHPGEFARLFDADIKEFEHQKIDYLKELATSNKIYICSKDASTVCCDGEHVYINTCGCNAAATAGSGDVYTGIIGALMCVVPNPFDAIVISTALHGKASYEAGRKYSNYSVTASDIISEVSELLKTYKQ